MLTIAGGIVVAVVILRFLPQLLGITILVACAIAAAIWWQELAGLLGGFALAYLAYLGNEQLRKWARGHVANGHTWARWLSH